MSHEVIAVIVVLLVVLVVTGGQVLLKRRDDQEDAAWEAKQARLTPDWVPALGDFNDLHKWLSHHAVKDPELTVVMRLSDHLATADVIAHLRSRVESLERAQGLKPGTSMHAGWKETE